jgi:hypothetical protein
MRAGEPKGSGEEVFEGFRKQGRRVDMLVLVGSHGNMSKSAIAPNQPRAVRIREPGYNPPVAFE